MQGVSSPVYIDDRSIFKFVWLVVLCHVFNESVIIIIIKQGLAILELLNRNSK